MKEKNNVYLVATEVAETILKMICIIKDEDLENFESGALNVLKVQFSRRLNQAESSIQFIEMMPFASEEDTMIVRNKVIIVMKSSSTLAAAYLSYLEKNNSLQKENNIPYFPSQISVDILKN